MMKTDRQKNIKNHKRNLRKKKTEFLILNRDYPERELDFEIDFQLSLTIAQRYEIMDKLVRDGLSLMKKHGHKKTPTIFARS